MSEKCPKRLLVDEQIIKSQEWLAWKAAWESCLQSKASEPVAWMFSNEEGDDDFGNNYQALKNKHYMGGPIVPLYSVPKASEGAAKPTEEMIEAGMRAWQERGPENHYVIFTADVVAMWNAMCAAAPKPPEPKP